MAKKKKKVKAGLITFLICLLIVVATGIFTFYRYNAQTYSDNTPNYRKTVLTNLSTNGLDRKIANMFISDSEIEEILTTETIEATEETEEETEEEGIEIHKVKGTTYEGYIMIVKDPERVTLGVNPSIGSSASGPSIEEYLELYDAVAGMNAGGFEDSGGTGNGGQAWGIVISDGKLVSGSLSDFSTVIGINKEHKLVCMDMSAQQALDWGVVDGVTFGPVLIQQFKNVFTSGLHPMLNPRTAIGQREDGAFLFLVLDGRQPGSLGALYQDEIDVLMEYGAMTAGNLDGGNSTVLMVGDEYVNTTVSMYGARNLPTCFLVLEGE